MTIPAQCAPYWQHESDGCPYGKRLPGDVTLPRDATPLELVAVLYSYIPFATILLVVVYYFLCKRKAGPLYFITFVGITTMLNEFLIKKLVAQPRPGAVSPIILEGGRKIGSCNLTCGMPSSHSTMAIGYLTLFVYDALWLVLPNRDKRYPDNSLDWSCKDLLGFMAGDFALLTHSQFLLFVTIWMALLMPVPLMRVVLSDHSAAQVFTGSSIGCFYAVCWSLGNHFINTKERLSRCKLRLMRCLHCIGIINLDVSAMPIDMTETFTFTGSMFASMMIKCTEKGNVKKVKADVQQPKKAIEEGDQILTICGEPYSEGCLKTAENKRTVEVTRVRPGVGFLCKRGVSHEGRPGFFIEYNGTGAGKATGSRVRSEARSGLRNPLTAP